MTDWLAEHITLIERAALLVILVLGTAAGLAWWFGRAQPHFVVTSFDDPLLPPAVPVARQPAPEHPRTEALRAYDEAVRQHNERAAKET